MNIRRTKDSFSFQSSSRIEIAHETWSWWSLLGFFFVLKRRASNSVTRWLAYFSTFGLCINENLPNGIQSLPKLVQDFPKKKINPQKFAQDFEDFAKMAKFLQIWSHRQTKMNKCVALQKDVQKTTLKRSKLSAWSSPSSSSTTASAHWRSKRRTERNNFQRLIYRCVSTCDAWILLAFSMCDSCLNFLNWCWNQCD